MQELTESQVRRIVSKETYSLDELISPSDIQDGAESWQEISEETLRTEKGRSAEIIMSENSIIRHLITDWAFQMERNDMVRIPNDICESSSYSKQELVCEYGIQPYKMDKWDCMETLRTGKEDPHIDYQERARERVISIIMEEMDPR